MHAARRRALFFGAALFFATAVFTLWQNARVAVLWDLSFLLDSSWRFALAQPIYRELPFSHAPGTFLLHAAILRLFGRGDYPHILCAALEAGTSTLLTWRILLRVLAPLAARARPIAGLLACTLVPLGIYSVYPHPIYDSECILALLFALFLFERAASHWATAASVLAGAACVLPLVFKQNIGLPFLAAALFVAAASLVSGLRNRSSTFPQLGFIGGALAALSMEAIALHFTVGLGNYLHWTYAFAAQRRLPGASTLLDIYRSASLAWTIPAALAALLLLRRDSALSNRWLRVCAFLLLAAPFLWTIIQLAFATDPDDRADQLLSLWPHLLLLAILLALANLRPRNFNSAPTFSPMLPLLLLAAIHGAFLSQQLWGSTYAIWPLLVLLIALLLLQVQRIALPLAAVVAITLLLCGGLYAASLERLNYIHLDGPVTRATVPQLRGMATPGPWIPEFEELLRFTSAEIPADDGILLIPGEDPFFFATGRVPQFPILLFDPATNPFTPQQTLDQAHAHNIRWLIVKRHLQLVAPADQSEPDLLRLLAQDFVPYRSLTGYDIYRHR